MKRSKEKYLTSKSKVISFKFRFSKKMFCFSSLEQRKEQLRKQNEELIKKIDMFITMEDATSYLKSIGEWESASKFDRQTILNWAKYLKSKEIKK